MSFKIKNYFSNKDPIPDDLKSFLVHKFTCASCSSRYNGGTCRVGLRKGRKGNYWKAEKIQKIKTRKMQRQVKEGLTQTFCCIY